MRRTGSVLVAVAVVTTVTLGGCSSNEGTKAEESAGRAGAVGTGGAGADVNSDGEFVRDIAMKNMAEVELSRMAVGRATSPDIKVFAQKMIDDHGAAAAQLKSIVEGQAIDWPAQLDEEHRGTADELGREQGLDFDREYLEAMVDSHQDLAAKLESRLDVQSLADWKTAAAARTQGQSMPDPDVALRDVQVSPGKSDSAITMRINRWAADTYPVAQKHLDTARALENEAKKRSNN